MASLLTLPREIRDQIYEFLISDSTSMAVLPLDPDQDFGDLIIGTKLYRNPILHTVSNAVLYEHREIYSGLDNLRLVNSQLNAETYSTLKRHRVTKDRKVSYDVDVIILDAILPLVTWTRVPCLTTQVERVIVTIRISDCVVDPAVLGYNDHGETVYRGYDTRYGELIGWSEGDSVPVPFYYQMWSILLRFVHVGPLGTRTRSDENFHFTADSINVKVAPEGSSIGPDRLAWDLMYTMRNIFRVGDQEPQKACGKILFGHFNKIIISSEGHYGELDIAKELEGLEAWVRDETALEDMRRYKENMWRLRAERGLKVLDNHLHSESPDKLK